MVNMQKCAMIGCGFVGASSAFSLVESGLFTDLVLIDANHDKAEGEAMDLSHGLAFTQPMEIIAGDYADLKDCGIIIISAGAGQKPGETRMDLVHKNVAIFKQIIPQIVKYNQEAILLVVANPVDILTWVTWKLSGFPAERVIGSGTVLDTARLKYLLGRHLDVDPRSVHAFIVGEHGDSELAVWSSANVSGVPLTEFCELRGYEEHGRNRQLLYEEVKNSAYRIIEKKGATYYGIALSVRRICECIVRDEHSILSVSSLIQGHFGLTDLCMGVPTILGSKGVERVLDIGLNQEEQAELERSATALKQVLQEIQL
ncbi:L-lactate dehydrogenase [Caproicibacterium amylolyticum]|jgi:L-lactate dehydrogenase|uniref:L-lactate dehydrogenase n=1 Tax=Caproicibacterium amylolyticum TaxID=2766537 RepID=A0A7G9WEH9_9FIRM|nr:L-lactate dehydrogenase [Caproicibacterium amylolyticum]MBE6721440.1 L-lactate dehydrogenase [Oscillospiraceae bacterium]QNO17091.1 L-lactate dehydrogenase [Caproicibacterium amylolyticum]